MGIRSVDKPHKLIKCYSCQFFKPGEDRCVLKQILCQNITKWCRYYLSDDICNERNMSGKRVVMLNDVK